ncbi:hypothetical protein CDL15_Pgr012077 [Punica granatum]|uniref:Leucine-rich repeat-containing N-terminal plant-type domain-containing protein n=1 Tax=Punica granatum TaxID=22663 RepID=A0A218XLG4_PUNGR|nr:hypothetical protein CDL15_Pgr012077 [Punica granatum]
MGECEALLQFSHSFIIMRNASGYGCGNTYTSSVCCSVTSYPKTASWKNGTGCCSWDGVTCHRATNYVTGLDLSRSWLQGTFHSNSMLFSLPNLRWLNLAGCNFYGSQISPKLPSTLTSLSLGFCDLRGIFPLAIFHFANLRGLSLFQNIYPKGTISRANWTSPLISLDLSDTNFHGSIPTSLRNLTSVEHLDLWYWSNPTDTWKP